MGSLFNPNVSIDSINMSLLVVALTLVIAFVFTLLVSFKMKGTKSFFVTSCLTPVVVCAVVSIVSIFLEDTTTGAVRVATFAVALGLIRFRSVNARAEELVLLFTGVAIGLISGLGFILYAAILAILVAVLYLVLTSINLFSYKTKSESKMLKITIPENLEYSDVFDDIFKRFLKKFEIMEVKTTAMGSLFRLTYLIEMNDIKEEKQFIDELRAKNGNLEISILPYMVDPTLL